MAGGFSKQKLYSYIPTNRRYFYKPMKALVLQICKHKGTTVASQPFYTT